MNISDTWPMVYMGVCPPLGFLVFILEEMGGVARGEWRNRTPWSMPLFWLGFVGGWLLRCRDSAKSVFQMPELAPEVAQTAGI